LTPGCRIAALRAGDGSLGGFGGGEAVDFAVEVPGVVFDVPDGVVEDGAEGLGAAFGVEAGAVEGRGREGGEPLGGPLAEGVDGGDEGGDGELGAGLG